MSAPIRDFTRPATELPMTVREVAQMLGVHPQKVRRLEAAGVFPPARRTKMFSRRYYFATDVPELWRRLNATTEKEVA